MGYYKDNYKKFQMSGVVLSAANVSANVDLIIKHYLNDAEYESICEAIETIDDLNRFPDQDVTSITLIINNLICDQRISDLTDKDKIIAAFSDYCTLEAIEDDR